MAECNELGFVILTENAFPPVCSSPQANGLDFKSVYSTIIPQNGKVLLKQI